jgi:hypothetical protein
MLSELWHPQGRRIAADLQGRQNAKSARGAINLDRSTALSQKRRSGNFLTLKGAGINSLQNSR